MPTADQKLDCALDLMRRLPPQYTERNLCRLVDLVPDICEDLLSSIDQPLKVVRDETEGKDFLVCDYNRDGDSHRSPYSNTYFPPMDDGALPSDKIRQLEIQANEAFDKYREMYYEGGIASAYLWELDTDSGFAGVILVKKSVGAGSEGETSGCWDSINVVEVQEKANGRSAHYKLTSTTMLWLQTGSEECGSLNLGGSMTRQVEADHELSDQTSGHIKNIGIMVEELENKIRAHLNDIYFGKTKDIVNGLRSCEALGDAQQRMKLHQQVISNMVENRQK